MGKHVSINNCFPGLLTQKEKVVSSLLSIAVTSTMTKSNLEKKKLIFSFYSRSQSITEGSQAGTPAETQRNAYCLVSWLIMPTFIYSSGPLPK